MKNDKDINSSLSEIKKVLTEKKELSDVDSEKSDFYLLKDVIKKGADINVINKNKIEKNLVINKSEKKFTPKSNTIKKSKLKKVKVTQLKKEDSKSSPVENVINKEIKPIIRNWIKKNLRVFVKKVVVEEFKVISKTAFKHKSISK